ncbi:MAG: ABC transporter permease [Endomicrobiales bacterium]|nr:ABC transporter permease [Endomicrobiales bacterium]
MKLLIMLSLRNLLRQKRRNILLGIAMAVGVTILVVANSFSRGMSDIMFNKILRWVTGHVTVAFNEKSYLYREVCRDKERFLAAIEPEKGLINETDEAIGAFVKTIGNGKSDNSILVGVDLNADISEDSLKEINESFRLVDGVWEDLKRTDIENPGIISDQKADYLNLKLFDVIRLRLRNIYGQDQAARVTVVGIMKNDNIFMQPVLFTSLVNTKKILGMRDFETGNLNLTLKNPEKDAVAMADRIYSRLEPGTAFIKAGVAKGDASADATILGFRSDKDSIKKLESLVKVPGVRAKDAFAKDGALISASLAKELGATKGDSLKFAYDTKYAGKVSFAVGVNGVFAEPEGLAGKIMLMHEQRFYDYFYDNLPDTSDKKGAVLPDEKCAVFPLISPEWILLERSRTTDEYEKKYKQIGKKKWKATLVDVRTMYESASDILKLEGVLNLITLVAVMVLFFIILIGVVNTLRMTVRERTREIGTIRAIGMQKSDVRHMFILETLFLALISSIAGIILAFLFMWTASRIPIQIQDNPLGMLLVNSRLYFLPSALSILGNVVLILFIAVVTAFFPARRAANLSPSQALRHFE